MDKSYQWQKKNLEAQLQWSKEQDSILKEIIVKFLEMKRIAEYAIVNNLSSKEIDKLNNRLNDLKMEVHTLENQSSSVIH